MRGAPPIASRVDENPPATIHFVKLLGEVLRITLDQHPAHRMGESLDFSHIRLPIQRHGNVKSFRSRSLYPTRKPKLVEKTANRQGGITKHRRVIYRWVEVEHADVRMEEIRRTRYPYVRRNAVLVDEPQQGFRVRHQRIVDSPFLLGNLDASEPVREPFRHILLNETLFSNSGGIPFHRD